MRNIPLGTRVTIIHAIGPSPRITHGAVTAVSDDEIEIRVDEDLEIAVASKVILDMPTQAATPRLIVTVLEQVGRVLRFRLRRVPVSEAREYPRVTAPLGIRYRLARGPGDPARWLAGEHVPGVEHAPDPHVNFSVGGVSFEDGSHLRPEDRLLMELTIPGEPQAWRCVGRVLRARELPPAPGAVTTHRYSVAFESTAAGTSRALARYTATVQERLLGGA